MARDSGRNHMRESIAHIAARLMAEDGIEDYAQAKRKAARQVGASDARQMPNNDEIDVALTLYRGLYQSDHSSHLRELRQLALAIMDELAAFNPHLTGAVLRGSAGKYADIQLQVFSDNSKTVEHYLLDRDIRFRTAETRLYAGDMALVAPALIFDRDGYDVYLTLLSPRDLRLPLRTTVAGKPMERAKREAVAALIEEN
jgi:hypothetical protein